MAQNLNKIDQLHNLMPAHYNTRVNPNWNALITALGTSDQNVADLVALLKQQFFIKTASGTYLNNLGANSGVSRPLGVGMVDSAFKSYIPVLAYTPKQVRLIIDKLLNIFFVPEITTAFTESTQPSPYALQNGWTLEYTVDGINDELIYFHASDFANINAATATEIAAAINRQAKYSNAEDYFDNVSKHDFVKIFSNTVGSRGSIKLVGGLADIVLQFNGFIAAAGTGSNTQWTITKVGQTVTMQWTGGMTPNLNFLQAGDVVLSLLSGNTGYFAIENVNLSSSSITFTNLFGTPGVYTQTAVGQVSFFSPIKNVVYTQPNRAVVWEITPGEVIVEMPTTPPVVKRSLIGSAHLNGLVSIMTAYNSSSSLTVADASAFPATGNFWLQEVQQIQARYFTPTQNTLASTTFNTRLQGTPVKYTYTGKTGNILTGITPPLPALAVLDEQMLTSLSRTGGVVTATTATVHDFQVGENVGIYGSSGIVAVTSTATLHNGQNTLTGVTPTTGIIRGQLVEGFGITPGTTVINIAGSTVTMSLPATASITETVTFNENLNGGFAITSTTSNTFTYNTIMGTNGSAITPGTAVVQRAGLSPAGSEVIVTNSLPASITGIKGCYVWDLSAPFVLSDAIAQLVNAIQAGQTIPLLNLSTNTIPAQGGYIVFDYGLTTQEGPVKYLYAPNNMALVLDPSYIFQHSHTVGSTVTAISHLGPHIMSGQGTEYPPYITNPSDVRVTLEELIQSVASTGIFIDFLIHYPDQLYSVLPTYTVT